jgi:hypothetical protein
VAEITLSHLRKGEGYKEPALVEGIRGSSANREDLSENTEDDLNILLRILSI